MSKVSKLEVPAEDRAHYSQRTVDYEFEYPFGKGELLGLAYRGDYDLSNHKLEYRDPQTNEKYIPHVVETSMGVERLLFALIVSALEDEELEDGETREVLKLKTRMAPYCLAVAPLTNKLDEEAHKLYVELKQKARCNVTYAKSGSIGKRYRKQDNIGTPFVATVDFDSLEDGKVTIRNRDTMEQERVSFDDILDYIKRNR
jgi:glycyl-tRNA synthetase